MVKIPKLKQQLKSCGNEKQQQNIAEKKMNKIKTQPLAARRNRKTQSTGAKYKK